MKLIEEADMPYNSGKGFVAKQGQRIRFLARSHIDFIPFNLDDMRERFDQGRTAASSRLITWIPREITRCVGNSPPLPAWASAYHLRNSVMGSGVAE